MEAWHAGRVLEAKAPAKINLFLEVLHRLPDGYHELSSVIVPVDLYDELVFERTDNQIELLCDDRDVPSGDENLVMKAAKLLRETCNVGAGVRINLKKNIPAGAGLGGGSSDAATTIMALNQIWDLDRPTEEMLSLARLIGADVPVFLYGVQAHVRGIGHKVSPIENNLERIRFVIAVPHFGVSTGAVYSRAIVPLPEERRSAAGMIEGFLTGDTDLVERNVFNRLQESAFEAEPRLRGFYDDLNEVTNLTITMSGSGSSFFTCCGSSEESENAAEAFREIKSVRLVQVVSIVSRNSLAGAFGSI